MHYALRPFILFFRYWPQLAACYMAGLLGRLGAIELAAWAGHDSNLWASTIMPLAGMARLGSYVAMFLVLRPGLPELAQAPPERFRQFDLFSTVIVPFFAIYLAWQMFKEDWLAFEARALDYRVAEAMVSQTPTELHPEDLPVSTTTWVLIIGALILRLVLNKGKERLPAWTVALRIYFDALWVFLVLTFSASQGLSLIVNPSKWISERRAMVWLADTRQEAFSHIHGLEKIWQWAIEALNVIFGGAVVPLLWLAVAGIVYGVSSAVRWTDAARRIAGERADRFLEHSTSSRTRLGAGWQKLPEILRGKTREQAEAQIGKFKPITDSIWVIAHAGLFALILYVLGYVTLAWLDMSGSFYRTQFGPGYLFRGFAFLFGAHPFEFWDAIGNALVLISHLVIEPLRVTLVASMFSYCVHHVQISQSNRSTPISTSTSKAASEPESVHHKP